MTKRSGGDRLVSFILWLVHNFCLTSDLDIPTKAYYKIINWPRLIKKPQHPLDYRVALRCNGVKDDKPTSTGMLTQ